MIVEFWYSMPFLSKIALIPRYPAFRKAAVKFVAGTTSLVGYSPLLSAFLWSLISNFGVGTALIFNDSSINCFSFIDKIFFNVFSSS